MKMDTKRTRSLFLVLVVAIVATTALAVEKPTTTQQTCITEDCHANYQKDAYVHGPVSLGDCKSCHKEKDAAAHTYELLREGKDLCSYCHLDQVTSKNVHKPLEDGACADCHDPHSSNNKFMLPTSTVAGLCENCHKTTEGMEYLHGPVAIGECTVCHDSHSSDYDMLLTEDPADLCFSCHVVTKEELSGFEFVHEPASNDCAGCHDPHGGSNAQMLKAEAPELCYSCHENIKNIATNSKYQHDVVSEPGGCLKCHTPHASTVRYGLKADPTTLCMSCHDKPVGLSKTEVLGSFTDELENKKFPHGPVAEKDCKGCHISHGSDYFRLLAKDYPPQFYAPYKAENYELCFSCHQESIVRTAETTRLTNFRNGNQNLHYLHVNKEQRGRTCRSCHETHASNLPNHIRASVPFGKWSLPINFGKTETGGTCAPGCHKPKDYDRNQAVDYSKPIVVEKPIKTVKEPEEDKDAISDKELERLYEENQSEKTKP